MNTGISRILQKICYYILDLLYDCNTYDEVTVSKGDVLWCLMPLPSDKIMKIPPGHRIRPFVIIGTNQRECIGYACSSKANCYPCKEMQYYIDKQKYNLRKSSYVDITHEWKIPYENIKSYFYTLDDGDFLDLMNFDSTKHANVKKLEYGKGTIIKRNGKLFMIYGIEKNTFMAFYMKQFTNEELRKGEVIFSYNDQLYNLNLTKQIEIINVKEFCYCSQLTKNQIADINKRRKELQKLNDEEINNVLLKGLNFKYHIGTIFYYGFEERYFIYLYHIKNKAYGIYTDEEQGGRFILRKENLEYMRTESEICESQFMSQILYNLQVNQSMAIVIKYIKDHHNSNMV